ncbi:beta-galactosidase [Candidatus Caldatribacterium sp.]|uniref:beta-galactosidase n=1 Tax=Candidatus Caldatribacterium sp. TaxID=2282143 RepID=UPI0029923F0F|nr:beta-galactosidase [Candidatus Caldatribacterium sp.]MDW8081637.1 beta-galactosidase [Candidatus Calescibacterium sp.]
MLGVCYYPEHCGMEKVPEDLRRMKDLGIRFVRVGEFAWSRIEPTPGTFSWEWLDAFFDEAHRIGLFVILGTPTATPPKWLIDRYPDILPVDREGRTRRFGSRRHYCFSSPSYRQETHRIVTVIAQRYGQHPALIGWQTDNEYGCHDTVRCFCPRCQKAFQRWLQARYGTVENLNMAWGTVFWSQEYRSFDEIELPNLTVAEPNPSHLMDYFRFASDQVREYNRLQVALLRKYSPGRFVTHNFMGGFLQFDHFALAEDLDFASWDSYPLGHAEWIAQQRPLEEYFFRAGHPDIAAFNHDLYRGVGRGRFWVMEHQAGPVQWAPRNLSPAPGMVRLWTLEAFAHGAEVVSYFNWRQVPFAQEQMHSGLLRPDSSEDTGFSEVRKIAQEIAQLPLPNAGKSPVALVFDYEAAWFYEIEPLGVGIHYLDLVLTFYTALRKLGLDVDVRKPDDDLSEYRLVVVPSLPMLHDTGVEHFATLKGLVVFGPRTGSKTKTFHIPPTLPPGPLQKLLPLRIVRVETLGPTPQESVLWKGKTYAVSHMKEWVETQLPAIGTFQDGKSAVIAYGNLFYLAFWPQKHFLLDFFEDLAQQVKLSPVRLPEGVRLRRRGDLVFAFNYAPEDREIPAPDHATFILGKKVLPPHEVAVWRESP